MARVAILGATGRLGEQLALCALEEGYEVSALVREPRKVTRFNERFAAFEGDAFTGAGLDAALSGCSFVVSALGSRLPIMERCMRNVVERLDARRLRAVVFICPVSRRCLSLRHPIDSILRLAGARRFADLAAAEGVLRRSALPWAIVRPTRLVDGAAGEPAIVDGPSCVSQGVSRADFAAFVVAGLGRQEWIRRDFVVSASCPRSVDGPLRK